MAQPNALESNVWQLLTEVEDPELPISIVDMGIVHRVTCEQTEDGQKARVEITPTYTSCPAWKEIVHRTEERLREGGFTAVEVIMNYQVAWTPDKISPEGNEKLRQFGVARLKQMRHGERAECPLCSGTHVRMENAFGPTLCKMIYHCLDCNSPFEVMKQLGTYSPS